MPPFRSHIDVKVPEVFQLFCYKVAILASKDTVDTNTLKTAFQRIFQKKDKAPAKKKQEAKATNATPNVSNGASMPMKGAKKGSSGVGPLIVDPLPQTTPKKMKQTV